MDSNSDYQVVFSGQGSLPFPESLRSPAFDRLTEAVFVSDDRLQQYAAINAEEHLLLMARGGRDQVPQLMDTVRRMEATVANDSHPFAHDKRFGYLSFKPLFAGSGMHVQYLLHLPLLSYLKQIRPFSEDFLNRGFVLKPLGTTDGRNPAKLFLLSNSQSQGLTDQQIADSIQPVLKELYSKEETLQDRALNKQVSSSTLDQVWRSYGILRYARRLTTTDFLTHWSNLRMGAGMDILPLDVGQVDQLLPLAGEQFLLTQEADQKTHPFRRAELVRQKLTGGN